jgi:Fe-S oxidoreductase
MSERPRLKMLDERRPALETCAYCPKLSRAACPISDAEASETVTPWGKISATFDVARGAAEATPDHAALAWACSGCLHCRELCELKNPVAETLIAARSEYRQRGLAPAASERVRERQPARLERLARALEPLRELASHRDDAPTAVLLGCDYALRLQSEAEDAVRVLSKLFGALRLLSGCCGYPLEVAGDPEAAALHKAALERKAASAKRWITVDSGCAHRLRGGRSEPFAEAVLAKLADARLESRALPERRLRYHDSCLLGRGLGSYDAPRRLVARASPSGVAEFSYRRERARCSGAGALVPVTRPETAHAIAETRVAEHERLGGGTIVTACAGSLRSFRKAGAEAVDLTTVVRWFVLP